VLTSEVSLPRIKLAAPPLRRMSLTVMSSAFSLSLTTCTNWLSLMCSVGKLPRPCIGISVSIRRCSRCTCSNPSTWNRFPESVRSGPLSSRSESDSGIAADRQSGIRAGSMVRENPAGAQVPGSGYGRRLHSCSLASLKQAINDGCSRPNYQLKTAGSSPDYVQEGFRTPKHKRY